MNTSISAQRQPDRRIEYGTYILSPEWKRKRQWALEFWGNRCSLCNSPENLQVHHRTYERLGDEAITDLIVLCDGCHKRHHGIIETAQTTRADHVNTALERIAVIHAGRM
jgi:5-methylcytosine-specific restriction endonuclease McrA